MNFESSRIPYKKVLQAILGIPPITLRWVLNHRFCMGKTELYSLTDGNS